MKVELVSAALEKAYKAQKPGKGLITFRTEEAVNMPLQTTEIKLKRTTGPEV